MGKKEKDAIITKTKAMSAIVKTRNQISHLKHEINILETYLNSIKDE